MRWPERRWWICGMLFAATTIAYIDRQTFSFVASTVQKEYGLSNEQVARIFSAFLMSYTFGQPLAGRFFDRVGSRIGFAVSIGVWSLANMLTATVTAFRGFVGCRLALGLGESGNYPGGVKVVGEQFPPQERSFAGGVFTSGASVGAILAGPLVSSIAGYWGWRAAFLLTGGLGFLWLAGWWSLTRTPPGSSSSPRREDASQAECEQLGTGGRMRWVDLLRFRQVWAITIARFLEEPAFWIWIFWLPKYIEDKRGLSGVQTGWLLTQPFLALDLGYLSGGWIAGRLMRRGWSARRVAAGRHDRCRDDDDELDPRRHFVQRHGVHGPHQRGPHGPRGLVHQRDDDALGHRPSRDGGHPLRDHRDGRRPRRRDRHRGDGHRRGPIRFLRTHLRGGGRPADPGNGGPGIARR